MSIFRLVPPVSCEFSYWLSQQFSAVIIKKVTPLTDDIICQCGKGRDVGLNQIAAFEGKEASGNGEQTLSRDIYRCGQLFDFFRMLSFFFTSVGYYLTTMVGTFISYLLCLHYKVCDWSQMAGVDIYSCLCGSNQKWSSELASTPSLASVFKTK